MSELDQNDDLGVGDFIKEASLTLDERALAAFVRGMLARQAVTAAPNEGIGIIFTTASPRNGPTVPRSSDA